MSAQRLQAVLGLEPHPDGGFFKETFRDDNVHLDTSSLPSSYRVGRAASTAIYFLMPSGNVSHLHRIPSAEVWHFYAGEPLTIVEINKEGIVKQTILGPDIESGQTPQHATPPLVWFGAYPTKDAKSVSEKGDLFVRASPRDPEHHFTLVGCTVAPAFQFEDSELAKRFDLLSRYPHAKPLIEFLTHED